MKIIVSEISIGSAIRLMGIIPVSLALISSFEYFAIMGVLVMPGRITLTRIPLVASSRATDLVNAMTPPLEAV
uniref:Uncharacterized protein n=1 Tax=Ixodes ricinus TaxID=34613 RepID=A0A6B0U2J8_IXORI